MTTCLTVLRPRAARSSRPCRAVRPVPSSRPSSSWAPVAVEWDAVRGLHVARCVRCAEYFTAPRVDQVEDWAASHRCDAELAALLAAVTGGRAA